MSAGFLPFDLRGVAKDPSCQLLTSMHQGAGATLTGVILLLGLEVGEGFLPEKESDSVTGIADNRGYP